MRCSRNLRDLRHNILQLSRDLLQSSLNPNCKQKKTTNGRGGGGLTQLSNPSLITQVSSNPERNKMYHPLFLRVKKLIPTKVMHIFTLYRSESKPFIYTGFPKISIIYIDCSDSDTVHSIQLDPHVLESPPKLLESIYIRLVHLCNV